MLILSQLRYSDNQCLNISEELYSRKKNDDKRNIINDWTSEEAKKIMLILEHHIYFLLTS